MSGRIETRAQLKDWLAVEKKRVGFGGAPLFLQLAAGREAAVIWQFQRRMRITEYHVNSGHRLRGGFSRILYNRLRNKTGLHIGLNTCGRGLKIMHLGPILFNDRARVGENVSIHIMTAFVAQGVSNGTPTVGNNVVIGVGAKLIGPIHIADGIAVGANALVNKSFTEEGIAIAGVPARKVSDNGKAKWNTVEVE